MNLEEITIEKAHRAFKEGEYTPSDLVDAYLKEIARRNSDLNVFLEVFDDVKEQAKKSNEEVKKGGLRKLTGIPIAIKDNILIEGKKCTSASKILEGFVAPYDATLIKKLKGEGAILIGRTNMDEFAMGGSTENSAYGATKNPHDSSRVSGGSSGGSAAAVAANMCIAAIGSDTGGSIRQPASFCGVVGMKPSYGRVSRYGLMAMGSSLDQMGPIAKSVRDAEVIYNVIKGKDENDSTTLDFSINNTDQKKKIGVPRNFLRNGGIDSEVLQNFENSLEKLKERGYEIVDIDLPKIKYSLHTYYIIMPAEASSNLSRYDGVKYGLHVDGRDMIHDYFATKGEGFGSEVKRRIMLGTYVLSSGYYDAYYGKALSMRSVIKNELESTLEGVDAIVTPTSPIPAYKIGEKSNDPLSMYLADIFTVPANIAGMPAVSIPSGEVELEGVRLPLGINLLSKVGGEDIILGISKKFLGE